MKTISITLTEGNFRILRNTLYRRIYDLYPEAVHGNCEAHAEMEEIMSFIFQLENGFCDYDKMKEVLE